METNIIENEKQNKALDKKQFFVTKIYGIVVLVFMLIGIIQEGIFEAIFFTIQLLYILVIIMGIKFNSIILKVIGLFGAIIRLLFYFHILVVFFLPGFLFYDNGVYTPPLWRKLLIFDVSVMTPLYCISYMVYFDKIMKLRRKNRNLQFK